MKKLNIASLWTVYLKPFIIIFGNIIGVAFFISASIDQNVPSFLKLIGIILLSVNLLCIPWGKQRTSELDLYHLIKKFPNITEEEFLVIKTLNREDILKLFLESFGENSESNDMYIEAKSLYAKLLKEKIEAIKKRRNKRAEEVYGSFQEKKEKNDPFHSCPTISPDPTLDNK